LGEIVNHLTFVELNYENCFRSFWEDERTAFFTELQSITRPLVQEISDLISNARRVELTLAIQEPIVGLVCKSAEVSISAQGLNFGNTDIPFNHIPDFSNPVYRGMMPLVSSDYKTVMLMPTGTIDFKTVSKYIRLKDSFNRHTTRI